MFSFENIQNGPPNPVILWFNNGIQMTIPLVYYVGEYIFRIIGTNHYDTTYRPDTRQWTTYMWR